MQLTKHAVLAGLSLGIFASTVQAHDMTYNQPTRGFFIEHGTVNDAGKVSIELHTGSDSLNTGGGIRLGLPNSELIINSGLNDYDENEALLKIGMRGIKPNSEDSNVINWAIIAGLAHIDFQDDNGGNPDQTNIKIGVSATLEADAATFTVSPSLVYANGDRLDDTFLNLGIGGYVGVIDTASGLFSLGLEANFTNEDNADNSYAFGGRWAYNEQINIDIVPVVLKDRDMLGVPGLVRLNVSF